MKSFLYNLNKPFLLIVLYLIKVIILPSGWIDVGVLFLLVTTFLVKYCFDKYLEAKEKVISENQFRLKVQEDISSLITAVSEVKMHIMNPLSKLNKVR